MTPETSKVQTLPNPAKKNRTLNGFTWLLSLLLLGLIGYILFKHRLEIIGFPWAVNWEYLLLFFIVQSLAVGALFFAWHLMVLRFTRFNRYALSFKFYCLTALARRLPTVIPYMSGRLVLYKQIGISRAAIINCLALENILTGIGGAITFVVLIPFYTRVPSSLAVSITTIMLFVLLVLIINPRLLLFITNWFLIRSHREPLSVRLNRKDLFLWVGLYIIPWVFSGIGLFLLPRAFSALVFPSLVDTVGIATLSSLIAVINVIIPGALGVKEFAASFLLSVWVPLSVGLVITLIWRMLNTVIDIIWALVSMVVYQWQPLIGSFHSNTWPWKK